MQTKRLFDRDPYQTTFHAEVLSQEKAPDGTWKVILDKTCFYPESGGQPYDLGTLGQVQVVSVYEEGHTIYHYLEGPLTENSVEGHIDFERRFDHMQQHAGQHILSAAFKRLFTYETLAFHLGKQESSIDLKAERVTNETIEQVELLVNQIVMENRHIETRFFTRDEVEIHYLKKVPNDQEMIRMVHVTDVDLSACCGTHPHRTGELGLIKIINSEKHRGGIRVSFVCGTRAIRLLQGEHFLLQDMVKKLKTNQATAKDKLDAILLELDEQRRETRKYYQENIDFKARYLKPTHTRMVQGKELQLFFIRFESRNVQELKDLAKTLIEEPDRMVVFIHWSPQSAVSQWIIALSQSVSLSVKDMIEQLNEQYGGNGGGSRVFGQWSGESTEEQQEVFIEKYFIEQR
jgi:alanyl-tRNA synthetase